MIVKVEMKGKYGTYFTQVKEFKDDRHLENWLKWMDSNQDRVKVIGTSEVKLEENHTLEDKVTGMFINQMTK
jgi:hypothetical protein